jgi:hypothetical protein
MEIMNKKIKKPLTDEELENLKKYNKNYYEKVAKEKFSKPIKCNACNCNIQGYTFNKHMISKKHIFNSSSEEEKKQVLFNKLLKKQEKQIEKLNQKIEANKIKITD